MPKKMVSRALGTAEIAASLRSEARPAEGAPRKVGRPRKDTKAFSFRLPPDLHRKFAGVVRLIGGPTMSERVQTWVEAFLADNSEHLRR